MMPGAGSAKLKKILTKSYLYLNLLSASGEAPKWSPATWDGHPRCQLAEGEDVAVAGGVVGGETATKCPERG